MPSPILPTVTTSTITHITQSTAISGGIVISDGYGTVSNRGVCWSTLQNPTINDSHTSDGTGMGVYISNISGLIGNTTYYVRAYATNEAGTGYGAQDAFTTPPTGSINGLFSIGNKLVYISQGNLQYQASTDTWRFAENQWNFVGSTVVENGGEPAGNVTGSSNHLISPTYDGWIDLFGWRTGDNPTNTSGNNSSYYYGSLWGGSAIINGGTEVGVWHALSYDEWLFLINTRSTVSGMRYAKAIVNDVNGIIIFPDNWDISTHLINNSNNPSSPFSSNIIDADTWSSVMEINGAVFLPAAGQRNGTGVWDVNVLGSYWSTTPYAPSPTNYAGFFWFANTGLSIDNQEPLCRASSVRLVRDYVSK